MQTRARIVTRFSSGGYAPRDTESIESFFIDSAMDTDADSFSLQVGDPYNELTEVLARDNEVRVSIYATDDGKVMNLNTGFCDEITLDENNVLSLSGRDMTAVAADSQHPYGSFKLVRPHVFVADEARALKMAGSINLATAPTFNKFNIDGSESYWEVWYRMYRKRSMWVWADADGALNAGLLNYEAAPKYFFGEPANWISVERVEWRSNKKQRMWEVHIFGSQGDISFTEFQRDSTITDWIKRPSVLLTSNTARTRDQAKAEAMEEIFESQVGALEIKLMVTGQDAIIRQNNIARVSIKSLNLEGDFYIVGVKTMADPSGGLMQEIRLREKKFAISKRVPDPPKIGEGAGGVGQTPSETDQFGPGGVASNLGGVRWKYHFVEAANKYHGPWPFQLFLGVLLAIADHETGFRNVRYGSPGNEYPGSVGHVPSPITEPAAFKKFAAEFANDPKFGRVAEHFAVGPMQLFSRTPKEFADELGGSEPDELGGGRWEPRWNINAGASWLRNSLKQSGVEGALRAGNAYDLIWQGMVGYTGGPPWPNNRFVKEMKAIYDAKYKEGVQEAVDTARDREANEDGPITSSGMVEPKQGFDSLHRSLWEAYSIGRKAPYNFTDLGTYNPSSRLPGGGISDHAVNPAYAFDLGFTPASGWANLSARDYSNKMAGRPEVEYVICGNRIWSVSQGWHAYGSGGHENHVHVSGRRECP